MPDQLGAAVILQSARHNLRGGCRAAVHEDHQRGPIDDIAGGGVHAEARIGSAPIRGNDHALIQKCVGYRDAGLEHPTWIVSQVEHEASDTPRIVAFQPGHGPIHIICRGLAETRDAEVAIAWLEALLRDTVHFHLRATQREIEQPVGGAGPADGEPHGASRGPAHPCDRAGEVCPDVVAIDPHDLIAGQQSRLLRRGAIDGTENLDN